MVPFTIIILHCASSTNSQCLRVRIKAPCSVFATCSRYFRFFRRPCPSRQQTQQQTQSQNRCKQTLFHVFLLLKYRIRFPAGRTGGRGKEGMKESLVQFKIAVLNGFFTCTGPRGAGNTPWPAAAYVFLFILPHFSKDCKGFRRKNDKAKKRTKATSLSANE